MKTSLPTWIPAALLMAAALSAAAADSREPRQVSGFNGISLAAPIRVEVTQGDSEGLVLEGDAKALADIETVVENGLLKIRLKHGVRGMWNSKARAIVTARSIDQLAISGSGDIAAPQLRGETLKIAIAGSGDVSVGGTTANLSTSISGSGDVKAEKLEARSVRVSIAGSGDATVWARDSLTVSIMGSGDVRYLGDPAVQKSIMGSGSVKRLARAPT
jgi:Putative auto-transporter adhesin, head GIN domain